MAEKRKKWWILIPLLLAAFAAVFFGVRFFTRDDPQKLEAQYLQKDLPSYSEIRIIADDVRVDGERNSIAAVKEAVRCGATIVTLDLCFSRNGTPVICESYGAIRDDTLTLAQVLDFLSKPAYAGIQLHLRLRQMDTLDAFNALLDKYGMTDRVILSGIDEKRYGILTEAKTPVTYFYDYAPGAKTEKALQEIRAIQTDFGAAGVIMRCGDADEDLIDALNQAGIPYILSGVNQTAQMYAAIDRGASLLMTDDPEQLARIHTRWKEATQQRVDSSVLDALNAEKG